MTRFPAHAGEEFTGQEGKARAGHILREPHQNLSPGKCCHAAQSTTSHDVYSDHKGSYSPLLALNATICPQVGT